MGKVLLLLVVALGLFLGALWLRYDTVSPCGVLRVQLREAAQERAEQGAQLLGADLGSLAGALSAPLSDALAERLVQHLSPTQCARGVARVWMGEAPLQPGDVEVDLKLDLR